MARLGLLALFASLYLAAVVSADLPPPPGLKYFEPRVRFFNIEQHRDHVFFLHYDTGNDLRFLTPAQSVAVKNDAEFTLKGTGRFITKVQLAAVPRQQYEKFKNTTPPPKTVDGKMPGEISATIDPPNNTGPRINLRGPLTEYKVTLKDGKLTVGRGMKRADAGPQGFPGFALAVTLAALGLWFVRKKRPNAHQPSPAARD